MNKTPRRPRHRLVFGLRAMLAAMVACSVFAWWNPYNWPTSLSPPRPIRQVPFGQAADVDVIELNHRPHPSPPFAQLLFWSYHPDGKLHIREWRMVKNPAMLPQRDGNEWVCTWSDQGITYTVRAPTYRETTAADTPSDPELVDRNTLTKPSRIKLWK